MPEITPAHKAVKEHTERMKSAGFVLRRVWVHKLDREVFDKHHAELPNNVLYDRLRPAKHVRDMKKNGIPEAPALVLANG